MRAWWITIVALAACSGDGKTTDSGLTGDDDDDVTWDGDCDQPFTPCGGDPTGSWSVVGVCEFPLEDLDCGDISYLIEADRSSGTVEMNGDGTYDRVYNVDVDFEIGLPLSCIAPLPCGTLPTLTGGILDACTDDGTTCTCTGSYAETDSANGTWEVEGEEIVFDGDDRQAFCVQGDRATVRDEAGVRTNWVR